MAEFQDVMRQLGRICASNFGECDICDIRLFCPSRTLLDKYAKSGRAERLEEMVMQWAAEHPEPVYPSIAEYLEQFGIIICRDGTLKADFFKANEPMNTDIAQKLGIEPKEG